MADMTITFDAKIGPAMRKMANLAQAQQKVKGSTKGLTKEIGRLERGLNKKGAAAQGAITPMGGLTSKIQTMIGPAAALTLGVVAVQKALARMGEEANRAKERLLGLQDPTKKLQQVSGQVAKDLGIPIEDAFRFLKKKAEGIAATGAIPGGFAGAVETIFQSVSGGSFSAIDEIVEAAKFTDPAAVSAALGKLRDPAGFGPGIGSPAGVISKFSFAAPISDFLIEEQTKQASELVSFAKEAGIGFDELLAALTGASRGFPNPQRETTGFRAILSTIRKVEAERGAPFAGRTISEKLRAFEAADPKRFTEAKNREEFVLGLGPILGSEKRTRGLLPQITAQGETLAAFRKQVGLADIPEIKGPRETRGTAEKRAAKEAEILGPNALRRQKAIDEFAVASLDLEQRLRDADTFRGEVQARYEAFRRAIFTGISFPLLQVQEDIGIRGRGITARAAEHEQAQTLLSLSELLDATKEQTDAIKEQTRVIESRESVSPAGVSLGPPDRDLDNENDGGVMR